MSEQIGQVDATLYYVPKEEFDRVRGLSEAPAVARTRVFADMCRLNTLYMIARAGSGHIGSSFSSLDIVSWLYLNEPHNGGHYFSSKGHDVPGLYAVLIALGRLPVEKLHELRRLGGLPGHPDVSTPGVLVNSGSLGMGISKAKGLVHANRMNSRPSRTFVLTGDGELQEGQIWESLVSAANHAMGEITVIVDHNKFQSDYLVRQTNDMGDLAAKFASFGWHVERCDGHDLQAFSGALSRCAMLPRQPQVIIADTIKGRGVSFMEHTALKSDADRYCFHSGAPDSDSYARAVHELVDQVNSGLAMLGTSSLRLEKCAASVNKTAVGHVQRLIPAYSEALLDQAASNSRIVVLDADLLLDTGLIPFKKRYPERFVECGIAEMDMVSQAGGLALGGMLPICHSFACFLSTRPNEQIYNNITERTKVLYVGSLAGLIPAAPGHSHQSLRDISALGSIPNFDIVEPCCVAEVGPLLDYLIHAPGNGGYLRLISAPWEVPFSYRANQGLKPGRGVVLKQGTDAVIVTYGMIMASEAYRAAQLLEDHDGISTAVIASPFLNRVDAVWLKTMLGDCRLLCTVDNHYVTGGFGDLLLSALTRARVRLPEHILCLGLANIPACGQPAEILAHHALDAESLRRHIRARLLPREH